ncbi:MAG: FCD domain-containing protein [Streptosporangiales bacterium]|nr:FCD domain-containing protein [Streptosporangiales bacterium]
MRGELAAGAAVPQDEIARRLGVSITPVREALRRLESEGLVSYRAHRGATVSELSQEAARELYLLRGAVEGLTARLAATRITDDQLERLRVLHARMLDAQHEGRSGDLAPLSRELHDAIALAGGPAFLAGHLRSIWRENPVPPDTSLWHDHANAEIFLREHEDLLAALEAHDPDAAECIMKLHLEHSAAARGATFEN